jgi:hypothetical protein
VLAVTAGVLAGLTILVLWGPGAVFPLLLLGATVAVVGHEVHAARPRPDTPTGPPTPSGSLLVLPPSPEASSLARWSDPDLGRAWQTTLTQLQHHHNATPTGFAAWIASGTRAGSDPTRYLTTPSRTP